MEKPSYVYTEVSKYVVIRYAILNLYVGKGDPPVIHKYEFLKTMLELFWLADNKSSFCKVPCNIQSAYVSPCSFSPPQMRRALLSEGKEALNRN